MNFDKLLCMGMAQSIDYARACSGVRSTSRGGLDWTDIHKAMGTLEPEERAICYLRPNPAMIKGKELAALTNRLWLDLIKFERDRRPPLPETMTPAERMVHLAARAARDKRQANTVQTVLREFEDSKRCETCQGSPFPGQVTTATALAIGAINPGNTPWVTCPDCKGLEWMPWSDNRRCAGCGAQRVQWKPRYEPGYLRLLDLCRTLRESGRTKFMEYLFGSSAIETKLQARA